MDAFFNEYTIRNYVFKILEQVVLGTKRELWIASERPIKVFGYKKSNHQVNRRDRNKDSAIPDLELRNSQSRESTCLIEVK